MVLALLAIVFIIVFDASVTQLIPLYAIGVFLSFSLSQAGMARRWWKTGQLKSGEAATRTRDGLALRGRMARKDDRQRVRRGGHVGGDGGVCGHQVQRGRVDRADPDALLLVLFFRIHRHYRRVAESLSLENYEPAPPPKRHRVILPIGGVHQGTLAALRYAQLLSHDITAVHVSIDPEQAARVEQRWEMWGEGVRLVVLESPYRLMLEPLVRYIRQLALSQAPNEIITVVVPQFVPRRWFGNLLHTQTATFLRLYLLFIPGVIVVDVPYQVD